MATIPSTIVVFTEDKVNFPLKWAVVVMKQLFQYGVNKISVRDEKIFIELAYTPNAQRLKSKFGTLPVRYMRVKLENPQEFKILENVVKRYRFNLIDEDVSSIQKIEGGTTTTNKRKLLLAPAFDLDEGEETLEEEETHEHDGEAGSSSSSGSNKKQKLSVD